MHYMCSPTVDDGDTITNLYKNLINYILVGECLRKLYGMLEDRCYEAK